MAVNIIHLLAWPKTINGMACTWCVNKNDWVNLTQFVWPGCWYVNVYGAIRCEVPAHFQMDDGDGIMRIGTTYVGLWAQHLYTQNWYAGWVILPASTTHLHNAWPRRLPPRL